MDLVLCRSLIIILDLGGLCDQCYQMNLIEVFTSTQIQEKDFVYVNFFHVIICYIFLKNIWYVIFFAKDEKFVLIEFININNWYIDFLFSHKQGWVFSWHVITIYTSKYHSLPINMILIFIVSYENNCLLSFLVGGMVQIFHHIFH